MGRKKKAATHVGTLMARTLELSDASTLTTMELHEATGLPYYWLRKFRQRRVLDPSVNLVQRLYEYLSGDTLV